MWEGSGRPAVKALILPSPSFPRCLHYPLKNTHPGDFLHTHLVGVSKKKEADLSAVPRHTFVSHPSILPFLGACKSRKVPFEKKKERERSSEEKKPPASVTHPPCDLISLNPTSFNSSPQYFSSLESSFP